MVKGQQRRMTVEIPEAIGSFDDHQMSSGVEHVPGIVHSRTPLLVRHMLEGRKEDNQIELLRGEVLLQIGCICKDKTSCIAVGLTPVLGYPHGVLANIDRCDFRATFCHGQSGFASPAANFE